MSCVKFQFGSSRGFISLADIYRFEGYVFEWHHFCGPMPLHRHTLDPRKTIPPGFWDMVSRWQKLPKDEWEKYRI